MYFTTTSRVSLWMHLLCFFGLISSQVSLVVSLSQSAGETIPVPPGSPESDSSASDVAALAWTATVFGDAANVPSCVVHKAHPSADACTPQVQSRGGMEAKWRGLYKRRWTSLRSAMGGGARRRWFGLRKPAEPYPRVLVFGDSLLENGFGASLWGKPCRNCLPMRNAWYAALGSRGSWRAAPEASGGLDVTSQFAVASFATANECTQHSIWQIRQLVSSAKSELAKRVKKVVICIGTNNLGICKQDVNSTVDGVTAIVQGALASFPQAHVALLGLIPRGMPINGQPRKFREEIDQVNSALSKLESDRIAFADCTAALIDGRGQTNAQLYGGGLLHPNEKGHKAWSKCAQKALRMKI